MGSHIWMDCFAEELFLNSYVSDTVSVTLLKQQLAEYTGCFSLAKVEVAVLGSPSLIILRVSADVKQH